MWNARLNEAQAGIKIARRNVNNLRYADDTTFMAESNKKLKSLLMIVKEDKEQSGLKLNIQKTIMASGRVTSHLFAIYLLSRAPKSLQTVTARMKLKDACFLEEKLRQN